MIYLFNSGYNVEPTISCFPEDPASMPRTEGLTVLNDRGRPRFLRAESKSHIFSRKFEVVRAAAVKYCVDYRERYLHAQGKVGGVLATARGLTKKDLRVPAGVDVSLPCVFLYGVDTSGLPNILAFNLVDSPKDSWLQVKFHHLLMDTRMWSCGWIGGEMPRGCVHPDKLDPSSDTWDLPPPSIPPAVIPVAEDACRSFAEAKEALVGVIDRSFRNIVQMRVHLERITPILRNLTPLDAVYAGPVPTTPPALA